jgi:hypothetical protein
MLLKIMKIGFEAIQKKETIKGLQELERDFSKLPEISFKFNYKKQESNFAEKLVEDLK